MIVSRLEGPARLVESGLGRHDGRQPATANRADRRPTFVKPRGHQLQCASGRWAQAPLRRPDHDPAERHPDTEDLTAHFLRRYHEAHRHDFPTATQIARRIDDAHPRSSGPASGRTDHLGLVAADLKEHQQKEERILLPMMRAGGAPMIPSLAGHALAEPGQIEDQLRQISELTGSFRSPGGACSGGRELYRLGARLDGDAHRDMRLENEVLLTRFLGGQAGYDVF